MRLAILADPIDNQNAGIHVYTKEMVYALICTNPGHEIILIREKRDVHLKGAKQISLWNTRIPVGFASLRLFFLVPLMLTFKKADVVIEPAHFGPFNLPRSIKRVTVIHDLTPVLFPHLHRWHSQFLQNIFLKNILKKAHLIISNSDNTTQDICKVYPDTCKKVKRIYPGKGTAFVAENDSRVLEKYPIGQPYFLFVGTIEPRKNLQVLLKAFQKFQELHPSETSLVIAGGNGWKSESFFEALAHHPFKNKIHYLGYVELKELPTLYTHAVAFIYPSLYEGFGLPIVEAMSCGTPVIAADNSSLRESGGPFSLYFNAQDSSKLAELMSQLFADSALRTALSKAALQHVKSFNWDLFAKEMWLSLETLMARENNLT